MRRARRSSDDGAAAVEFAIVSVLLLTILFGILQYGYFFFQSTGIEHAAREGAREAAVGGTATLNATVANAAPAGTATTTTVCYRDLDSPANGYSRGDTIEVSVAWEPLRLGLPFVPFLSPGNLNEEAVARVERSQDVIAPGAC